MAIRFGHVCIESVLVETTKPGYQYRTFAPTGKLRAWFGRIRIPVCVARAYVRMARAR